MCGVALCIPYGMGCTALSRALEQARAELGIWLHQGHT